MPELVVIVGKLFSEKIHMRIDSVLDHHINECEVHIDIIIKTRVEDECVVDVVVIPRNRNTVPDDTSLVLELGRSSIGTSDGLSEPSSLDLVHHCSLIDGHAFPVSHLGSAAAA